MACQESFFDVVSNPGVRTHSAKYLDRRWLPGIHNTIWLPLIHSRMEEFRNVAGVRLISCISRQTAVKLTIPFNSPDIPWDKLFSFVANFIYQVLRKREHWFPEGLFQKGHRLRARWSWYIRQKATCFSSEIQMSHRSYFWPSHQSVSGGTIKQIMGLRLVVTQANCIGYVAVLWRSTLLPVAIKYKQFDPVVYTL